MATGERERRMEVARRLMKGAVGSMGVAYSEDPATSEVPAELSLFHARWLDYVEGSDLAPLREAFTRWRLAEIEAHKNDGMLFGIR